MKKAVALLIFLLSGCIKESEKSAGTVREVRVERRAVAWGVSVAKQQVEIIAVMMVLDMDCGGRMIVSPAGRELDYWSLARRGDRVTIQRRSESGVEWMKIEEEIPAGCAVGEGWKQ